MEETIPDPLIIDAHVREIASDVLGSLAAISEEAERQAGRSKPLVHRTI